MAIGRPSSGLIGVNLSETVTATGSSSNQGNQVPLGTRVTTTDGQEYLYVLHTTPSTIYGWVGIDENFEASPLCTTNAEKGHIIGVTQISASIDQSFGWVAVKGANLLGQIAARGGINAPLFTAAYASGTGVLDNVSMTAESRIEGVVCVAFTSGTASAGEVLLNYPHVDLSRL